MRPAARAGRPLRARADDRAHLARPDIDLLSATPAALGHPGLCADIAQLADAHTEQLPTAHRRTDWSLLVRLTGLLDLAPTDDTDCSPPSC